MKVNMSFILCDSLDIISISSETSETHNVMDDTGILMIDVIRFAFSTNLLWPVRFEEVKSSACE